MAIVTREKSNYAWLAEGEADWRKVCELLKAGQYELVAEFLHQAQIASEQTGDVILADIVAACRQICLACGQFQAGAEWLYRTYGEASGRERELSEQLYAILELIAERDMLEAQAQPAALASASTIELSASGRDVPELVTPHSLWQRVQGLLGLRPSSQSLEPERKVPAVSGETPASSHVEEVEVPVAPLPDDKAERPIEPPVEKAEAPALPSGEKAEVLLTRPPAEEAKLLVALPPEQTEVQALSSVEEVDAPIVALSGQTETAIVPPTQEVEVVPASSPAAEAEAPAAPPVAKEEQKEERGLPALVVYCLGPFRVYQNDQLIAEWSSLKGQSILKYLVMHKGRPVAKDILMDLFWPDVDPEDTRRNLHQAIYSLRQTLRQGQSDLQPILFKKDCYLLNPEMVIWLDFAEFEKHVQAGRRLEAAGQLTAAMPKYSIAEGLYQGDLLEEDLYEDWPSLQREHLRNLYLDILDRLSKHYVQQGEFTAAIALCQKILAKDNCSEEAYRRLMQCYQTQGQRHLAVRQYQTCVQALKEELNLTPSEETVALYRRITTG